MKFFSLYFYEHYQENVLIFLTFDILFVKIQLGEFVVLNSYGVLMEKNVIKFAGDNSQLFTKQGLTVEDYKKTLIVPETHNAIMLKDGQMLQTLSSGKYAIEDFIDVKTETDSILEILFMSKTAKLKMLWGTAQKLLMFDNQLQESYYCGFSGDFEVQIGDPRKSYLYLVGASEGLTAEALQERLQSNVVAAMESVVADYTKTNNVSFSQLAVYKKDISQKVLIELGHKLQSEYGIAVFSFNIANIIIDEKDLDRLNRLLKGVKKNQEKKICPACGAKIDESAKFCPLCGIKIGSGKVCQNCGADNQEGSLFCSKCGNKF